MKWIPGTLCLVDLRAYYRLVAAVGLPSLPFRQMWLRMAHHMTYFQSLSQETLNPRNS